MKRRAIKAQPCQNLNEPAGMNNIAATMIRPREKRRTSFDLRLLSSLLTSEAVRYLGQSQPKVPAVSKP